MKVDWEKKAMCFFYTLQNRKNLHEINEYKTKKKYLIIWLFQ